MSTGSNLALICDTNQQHYVAEALACMANQSEIVLVSDKPARFSGMLVNSVVTFDQVGLDRVPIAMPQVQEALQDVLKQEGAKLLLIDMSWGMGTVSATANFDQWGGLCDYLVEATGLHCVSLYNRNMLIDDHLMAALRGHYQFLSPAGVHENPFWLPNYLQKSSVSQQVDFLLGRVVPDYEPPTDSGHLDQAATGANPGWLINQANSQGEVGDRDERWKIRCFGRLRIYKANGEQINWKLPGSSTKKTKTLFAYLLQRGQRGASAEHMAELLWPLEDDETVKRGRLHQCIAMLRKTLGSNDYVARNGDYYHLIPPSGSWIDVANFEQLCRQAKVLAKTGKVDEAIDMLQVADQLYTGKLFEDLPIDYVESETEDWCLAQRMWFREMAIKVQRDMAELLRQKGQYRQALVCCNKAIDMDPLSEMAHAEAMKIYCEQSRFDAAERQYRQYLSALNANGISQSGKNINMLMDKITRKNNEI